jgi:hypothetical protein
MREYEVFVVLASLLAMELWRARTVPWTGPRRAWLLTLALAVGAVGIYLGCVRVYIQNWDYLNGYYHAGRLVLLHATDRFYVRDVPNEAGGFVNLPIVSLLYVPLALLSPAASVFVNAALGLASVALTLYLLVRGASARAGTLITILFLASGPLWYSLTMGNVAHFLMLPIYGIFILSAQRRDVLVGVLIALLFVIKPYLLILAAYFAFRHRFKITASFVLTWAAVLGASVALFGVALHVQWWHFLKRMDSGPLSGYNNQSLDGFLIRLLQGIDPLGDVPQVATPTFRLARLALAGGILGASGWVFLRAKPPRSRSEEWLEIAIILCLGTVIAPVAWSYYYALMLIPLALHVRGDLPIPRAGFWPMVLAAVLLTPPVQLAPFGGMRRVVYEHLLISHYFLGGLLLLGVLLSARWLVGRTNANLPSRGSPTSRRSLPDW